MVVNLPRLKTEIMKRYILFLAIPVLLQSCSSMYIPAVRSIPLLEDKGEFQAEAGASTNSVYVNGSYAFTDKIAASINGNMSYGNFSNRYDVFTRKDEAPPSGGYLFSPTDRRGKFSHCYGEVSMGRINMLSTTFPLKPMKLEAFGGMGMGRATDIDRFNNDNQYKTDYYSLFGQGNFGFKLRYFEVGASLRLAYSHLNYTADRHDHYQSKFDVVHIEPMFFGRGGTKKLKAVFRIGLNFAKTINPNEEYAEYRGLDSEGDVNHTFFHFSIGVSYRIGNKSTKSWIN
jgi:hypothetical protein